MCKVKPSKFVSEMREGGWGEKESLDMWASRPTETMGVEWFLLVLIFQSEEIEENTGPLAGLNLSNIWGWRENYLLF